MHQHVALLEVDVLPRQRLELADPDIEIDREREEPPPPLGDSTAVHCNFPARTARSSVMTTFSTSVRARSAIGLAPSNGRIHLLNRPRSFRTDQRLHWASSVRPSWVTGMMARARALVAKRAGQRQPNWVSPSA
jgi:hypothetical protein